MNNEKTHGRQQPEAGADYAPGLLGWIFDSGSPDPGLNWPAVLRSARQQQVSPFLFYRLQHFQDRVPSDVWQEIQSDFLVDVYKRQARRCGRTPLSRIWWMASTA